MLSQKLQWIEERPEIDRLRQQYPSLMLYGSMARGDAGPMSDVDLLAVAPQACSPPDGDRLSLTVYTEDYLRELARRGSLFVLHLRTEGRVLWDEEGTLTRILEEWREPDYLRMREGIRAAAAVLDVPPEIRAARPEAYLQVALFILRSVLYLHCAALGSPVFAMARVAVVLGDLRIASLFDRAARSESIEQRYQRCLELLADHLGGCPGNPFGGLEALAVSWHLQYPIASQLAVRLIVGDRPIEYTQGMVEWTAP